MSDIVEKLRRQAVIRAGGIKMEAPHTKLLEWQAAAEIERLQAALREIIDMHALDRAREVARAALFGKGETRERERDGMDGMA